MPIPGTKPKPDGQKRNRVKPVVDWVDVLDEPYRGVKVTLPAKRRVLLQFGNTKDISLHALTKQWWKRISTMPHCRLWAESDWQYALTTALVADAFFYGQVTAGQQLAQREKVLGTTVDSRRDLRIRYVTAVADEGVSDVANLDDYRTATG